MRNDKAVGRRQRGDIVHVVITGAAGFIGSHLSDACLARGWSVTGIDDFTAYYDPALKRANVQSALADDRFHLIETDLATAEIGPMLEGADVIFHLAAQAGVRGSWGSSFDTYTQANVTALQRLLEAAKALPLQKLVFASSSSIYGDAEQLPTRESANPAPVSPYGATKMLGEHLCTLYRRSYGVPVATLRYFSVFGPRQRPDMAFWRLIDSALHGTPMTVFGDGRQTRDFTYVEDIVRATIATAELAAPGAVYNVGGGSRISLVDAIEIITDELGAPNLTFADRQRGDARDTAADTTRIRTELEFVPSYDVAQGLEAQMRWQRGLAGTLVSSS